MNQHGAFQLCVHDSFFFLTRHAVNPSGEGPFKNISKREAKPENCVGEAFLSQSSQFTHRFYGGLN